VSVPAEEIAAGSSDAPFVGSAAVEPAADPQRVLRLAMRVGILMLSSGAQTNDAESSITTVARALGLPGVQAAVTFSTVSVSYYAGPTEPATTLLHLVRDRTANFTRLAGVTDVARRIGDGHLDLASAEQALDEVEETRSSYGQVLSFAVPGLSAAGSTLMFGGNLLEAGATLGIGLAIQPLLVLVDRSTLPEFFRLAIGSAASALLVVLLVGVGLPISEGLVLTGSLLRFLPGYALVSSFRDLIDGSVVSGTSRLAEALLLAAAVAGGTGLALGAASQLGVDLGLITVGQTAWGLVVSVAASILAVGAYAIRLGVPPRAVWQAASVGAVAWLFYRSTAIPFGFVDPAAATLVATMLVGALGRILARRFGGVTAVWVVPAILPFLPGLQLVQAMLAETDVARVTGLVNAAGTAFIVGTGVATGDILIQMLRGVRDQVVGPAVGAVVNGVDVAVIGPVERAVDRARQGEPKQKQPRRKGPTAASGNGTERP
jgi:uncharacterized membrane protein YjjP (DUF1212 family)